ncbi:MAG: Spy/CpxP family protein refolding chaperone [Desulfuromusa sp.]|nr:Spy/CpxP family protein refolding chaperone [Desulfuromusa sp.]
MKKTTIISTLLIAILLSGGATFAWSSGHGKKNCGDSCDRKGQGMSYEQHEERMETHLGKMAVILDLTDQQKGQIKDLLEKKWQDHQSMRAEMQTSRESLREYKQGKEFNESEFRTIAQKQADLKTEMMVQRAKTKQQLFAVLTPEQQQKAEKLRTMHGESFFGKHGGDRDGDGYGKRSGNRDCDGHGKRGGKGSGQKYHN